MDLWFYRVKRSTGSVSREKREPQAGPASCLSDSASKEQNASGEAVSLAELKTKATVHGEVVEGLPGSKNVARAEGDTSNEGGPEGPCRTNCEGQAGREAQPQKSASWLPGVGLANSSQRQGASPEAGEGANSQTKLTQATNAVRLTEPHWQPSYERQTTCLAEEPGA